MPPHDDTANLLVAGNHYTVSMLPKAHYVALTAFPGVFFQAGRFEYAHTNVLTLPREGAAQAEPAVAIVDVGQEFFSIVDCEVIIHEPNVDRTSPPSSREPDLPSSLLTRLDVPGGLTKGKRD